MKMLRVLIIAEAANPQWVSVPLVGWSHTQALARVARVHLVTQVRNRPAILEAGWVEGRDFTAIDSERLAGPLWKLASVLRGGSGRGWTTLTAVSVLSYYYFEHLVWRRFGKAIQRGDYDVVHRLTPLTPTTPSPLARHCRRAGVPFVLGPLNGGVPWPAAFDAARRQEREWLSYVRRAYRLLPGYRGTLRSAAAVVVGSRDTLSQIPASVRPKCVYLPENAVDPERFRRPHPRRPELPLRLAFVGRLVPYKGPDMLLEAAAGLIRQGQVIVELIGEGPLRPTLESLIAREGLRDGAHLAGWVDHGKLQGRLAETDVLVFPSIREFGGGVVLEAMALRVPALVVDYGGPAELVTPETGWLVPLGTRLQIVAGLRAALDRLCADPDQIVTRGAAAARRVARLFTWDRKAHQMLAIYRWALGAAADKPDFGMPLTECEGDDALSPRSAPAAIHSTPAACHP